MAEQHLGWLCLSGVVRLELTVLGSCHHLSKKTHEAPSRYAPSNYVTREFTFLVLIFRPPPCPCPFSWHPHPSPVPARPSRSLRNPLGAVRDPRCGGRATGHRQCLWCSGLRGWGLHQWELDRVVVGVGLITLQTTRDPLRRSLWKHSAQVL